MWQNALILPLDPNRHDENEQQNWVNDFIEERNLPLTFHVGTQSAIKPHYLLVETDLYELRDLEPEQIDISSLEESIRWLEQAYNQKFFDSE